MRRFFIVLVLSLSSAATAIAQDTLLLHNTKPAKLVLANAMILDGIGTPAYGPVDLVIENGRIKSIRGARGMDSYADSTWSVIDASGQYLLPGFVNMHGHLQDSRAGMAFPFSYQYKLWLGAGITTMRDVGSNYDKALAEKRKSAAGEIAAPHMLLYMWCRGGNNEQEIRTEVRRLKNLGADGLKCHQMDRYTYSIVADEARKQGLKIAHHVGVKDANAWHDAEFGTSTIEHWYGVPDAALDGVQSFPADFNHSNELHRFRYAGRLWREANPEKLQKVLKTLVMAGVAWDPTLCIYEASRDLQRALTQPWFDEYLHPALEKFFTPNPKFHGSFFFGWTNTDEVYWRENYQIWMRALRDFARMGGTVTTGEDAGFIYQMYGFGYLRELQLHEEAGFHPLAVIKHATYNGAKVLGMEREFGRLRPEFRADVIVVNGNPLENLQILLPTGINPTLDEQRGGKGGVSWTIKAGNAYHAPTLFKEVREFVAAEKERLADEKTAHESSSQ